MPSWRKEALHPEGPRFVGNDGHDRLPDGLVAHERGERAHERHGGGVGPFAGSIEELLEDLDARNRERRRTAVPRREIAAQGLAALVHVADLRAVLVRLVEGRFLDLVVGDGDAVAVAELLECRVTHLLLLVGEVLALAGFAHPVALDGLREDHRGLVRRSPSARWYAA